MAEQPSQGDNASVNISPGDQTHDARCSQVCSSPDQSTSTIVSWESMKRNDACLHRDGVWPRYVGIECTSAMLLCLSDHLYPCLVCNLCCKTGIASHHFTLNSIAQIQHIDKALKGQDISCRKTPNVLDFLVQTSYAEIGSQDMKSPASPTFSIRTWRLSLNRAIGGQLGALALIGESVRPTPPRSPLLFYRWLR